MTDSTAFDHAGRKQPPASVAFDPAAPDLPLDAVDLGTVVLLLVGRADRRWAADTAVELCAEWARSGRRVVLADLHLDSPVLHEVLDADNLEGIVDVFLYGASIARSARPVRDRGFYFISAGTYEPDAEALYRHPRWPKLVAGFRDASASLVLFAPEATADLEALSRWTGDAVLLGPPRGPAVPEALAAQGIVPRAMLVPPGTPPEAEPAPPAPGPPPPQPAPVVAGEDPELMLPPVPPRPEQRGSRGALVALAVVLLVLLLAGAGFLVARMRPDLLPWGGTAAPEAPEVSAAETPPAPSRAGEVLPYSVQVKAFTSLSAARQQVAEDQGRIAGTSFFISPEEIQGILYYKILAGLAPDTAAATALRESLVQAGAVEEEEAAGSWSLIQYSPLAFDLGEFPTAESAAAAADSLGAREVPAYAVAVPYSDGSRRWQLYGGAYRDSASAEAMRQRLSASGVAPRLVARIGTPPAAARPAGP